MDTKLGYGMNLMFIKEDFGSKSYIQELISGSEEEE